ncbi:MAG: hypothetical protein EZS28_005669 [Streblomastix strix]|uniref:Uncharacterized protein n=1 Tax=Streblomastix strix TaxID=222440 RepID=A0A5J4WUU5_9EUKA|nr:MAG: hypothetical protein EZS28_005669 [Streblomastix strix]
MEDKIFVLDQGRLKIDEENVIRVALQLPIVSNICLQQDASLTLMQLLAHVDCNQLKFTLQILCQEQQISFEVITQFFELAFANEEETPTSGRDRTNQLRIAVQHTLIDTLLFPKIKLLSEPPSRELRRLITFLTQEIPESFIQCLIEPIFQLKQQIDIGSPLLEVIFCAVREEAIEKVWLERIIGILVRTPYLSPQIITSLIESFSSPFQEHDLSEQKLTQNLFILAMKYSTNMNMNQLQLLQRLLNEMGTGQSAKVAQRKIEAIIKSIEH